MPTINQLVREGRKGTKSKTSAPALTDLLKKEGFVFEFTQPLQET